MHFPYIFTVKFKVINLRLMQSFPQTEARYGNKSSDNARELSSNEKCPGRSRDIENDVGISSLKIRFLCASP